MIKFVYGDKVLIIRDGNLINGDKYHKKWFKEISQTATSPQDGPVDYALASRMLGRKLEDEEIIKTGQGLVPKGEEN